MLLSEKLHRYIFIGALAIILVFLPFSRFVVSIGIITLTINFLVSGEWQVKGKLLKRNNYNWFILALFIPFVYSLLQSSNLGLSVTIIKIWLPLLLIPFAITLSKPLSKNELNVLLGLFVLSIVVFTGVSMGYYFHQKANGPFDARSLSPFISHIRLSLMVNMAIAIIVNWLQNTHEFKVWMVVMLLAISIWLSIYLFILGALTGVFMLVVLALFVLVKQLLKFNGEAKYYIAVTGLTTMFIFSFFIVRLVNQFYVRNIVNEQILPEKTVNGNLYKHDVKSEEYENGNNVYLFVCEAELERNWNKRSDINFDAKDKRGQSVKKTLLRYLASKGLAKDSVGMWKLDSVDISLIEKGLPNVLYRSSVFGFQNRLYEFLWELRAYNEKGQVANGSFVQRLVYAKAAWYVIKQNVLFGTGYGDVHATMDKYYNSLNVDFPENLRFMPHNQYLTIFASTGVVGLLLFLVGFLFPYFKHHRTKSFLSTFFMVMILLSMLTEDTLDTHIGVTFTAIFWTMCIFADTNSITLNERRSTD